jgi:hypothetical protein
MSENVGMTRFRQEPRSFRQFPVGIRYQGFLQLPTNSYRIRLNPIVFPIGSDGIRQSNLSTWVVLIGALALQPSAQLPIKFPTQSPTQLPIEFPTQSPIQLPIEFPMSLPLKTKSFHFISTVRLLFRYNGKYI